MARSSLPDGAPDWLAEALELRDKGFGSLRIANRIGVSRGKVAYWLKRVTGDGAYVRRCANCGKEFRAMTSFNKFCSRSCWAATPQSAESRQKRSRTLKRHNRIGRRNPNFRHGNRVGEREVAKVFNLSAKGERLCRNCGRPAHDAHHAVPRSLAPAGRKNLLNCLPLCKRCHSSWHRRGETVIYRDVFTPDEWAFIETLIGPGWLAERYPERQI